MAGLAGTASAATENNGVCETGEFCVWEHDDYKGGIHSSGGTPTTTTTTGTAHGRASGSRPAP
ncbi:peptidase inhibitor family I36 protein [Streptomyces acidicola]|uniref:peptidase inhibitor family I36 protein n=1 Tax=Streptomyces acidicola TaxID=2596892 RepID=UPI0037F3C09D